jgi:hypothetical protein
LRMTRSLHAFFTLESLQRLAERRHSHKTT